MVFAERRKIDVADHHHLVIVYLKHRVVEQRYRIELVARSQLGIHYKGDVPPMYSNDGGRLQGCGHATGAYGSISICRLSRRLGRVPTYAMHIVGCGHATGAHETGRIQRLIRRLRRVPTYLHCVFAFFAWAEFRGRRLPGTCIPRRQVPEIVPDLQPNEASWAPHNTHRALPPWLRHSVPMFVQCFHTQSGSGCAPPGG